MTPPSAAALPGPSTRQRILEEAVRLLAQQGLHDALLENAAAAAGCPVERARIYFRRSEDLVFALYLRIAADFEARAAAELPAGGVGDRFHAAMLLKMELVTPYREAVSSLLKAMLDPQHDLGLLAEQTEIMRIRNSGVFASVVTGAVDGPPPEEATAMIRTLYGAHLALMLVWAKDPAGGRSARRVLRATRGLFTLSGHHLSRKASQFVIQHLGDALQPLLEPPPDPTHTQKAEGILRRIFRHRRLLPPSDACTEVPCAGCFALHVGKVRRFVAANEPVHMLLPAFPAKSPNPRKTLGRLPDKAEECALRHLQAVCDEVRDVHPPGARLTICSDGRAFSDLVGVTDVDVTDYGVALKTLLEGLRLRDIDVFNMEDCFESASHDALRAHLATHYGDPLESVAERARSQPLSRALFNGIHRFLFEDRVVQEPGKSRTQVRNECKDVAYRVIQRSNAWGRLLFECFPAALRLSIHPQSPHSDKIGMLLGDADDAWLTPWHAVALEDGGRFRLVKRRDAEELGARVQTIAGRPSHYTLSPESVS